MRTDHMSVSDGAFKNNSSSGHRPSDSGGDGGRVHIAMSAKNSNSIYGSSTTVTPMSCKCKFYIKA